MRQGPGERRRQARRGARPVVAVVGAVIDVLDGCFHECRRQVHDQQTARLQPLHDAPPARTRARARPHRTHLVLRGEEGHDQRPARALGLVPRPAEHPLADREGLAVEVVDHRLALHLAASLGHPEGQKLPAHQVSHHRRRLVEQRIVEAIVGAQVLAELGAGLGPVARVEVGNLAVGRGHQAHPLSRQHEAGLRRVGQPALSHPAAHVDVAPGIVPRHEQEHRRVPVELRAHAAEEKVALAHSVAVHAEVDDVEIGTQPLQLRRPGAGTGEARPRGEGVAEDQEAPAPLGNGARRLAVLPRPQRVGTPPSVARGPRRRPHEADLGILLEDAGDVSPRQRVAARGARRHREIGIEIGRCRPRHDAPRRQLALPQGAPAHLRGAHPQAHHALEDGEHAHDRTEHDQDREVAAH